MKMKCPRCGKLEAHFVPPSLGEAGFYICDCKMEIQPPPNKWDLRFLWLAQVVSSWSKDPSTQVGAVIVRPDRTVCSMGYNGFPRGMSDDFQLYEDREIKYSKVIHGEMNALLFAREPVFGYTLYTTAPCCDRCVVTMIQAGIKRFVFREPTPEQAVRWHLKRTMEYLREADREVLQVPRLAIDSVNG